MSREAHNDNRDQHTSTESDAALSSFLNALRGDETLAAEFAEIVNVFAQKHGFATDSASIARHYGARAQGVGAHYDSRARDFDDMYRHTAPRP